MLHLLKSNARIREGAYLFVLTLCCFGLSLFRVGYTDSPRYLFLNWNLFLAFLPWFFTSLMHLFPKWRQKPLIFWLVGLSWLAFFPNAPYILTDLFHLNHGAAMPMWFDLVLILAFAWTGILFGFLSLWDLEKLLESKLSRKWIPFISVGLLFLSSFGIYLGRYLRWNSWDLLHRPFSIFQDVSDRVLYPLEHTRTWGVTFFMGILLVLMYISFRLVYARNSQINAD